MSWKTSRAFVSSEERIKRIEGIPLIYGYQTSGANVQFAEKENFPGLGLLTEGGFATDFILIRDNERRRMIIPGVSGGAISSDVSGADTTDAQRRVHGSSNNSVQGILAHGVSNGLKAKLNEHNDTDVFVFWYNGNWNIVKKDNTREGYIPVDLAQRVITSGGFQASDILPKLNKKILKHTDYESVSSEDMARLMGMKDELYSRWEFEGVLHIMLNTHMKDGHYLFKRWNDGIEIKFNIDWESVTEGKIPVRNIGMDYTVKGQYHKAIIEGFERWGNGSFSKLPNSPSNLGVDTINVSVKIIKQDRNKRSTNVINVINLYDEYTKTKQVSNVNIGSGWRINNVGKMTMYNFFEQPKDNGEYYSGYNKEGYVNVACHEFGHLVGLGDAYGADNSGNSLTTQAKELTSGSIMWAGSSITYIEIEMIFLAALKNEMQFFNNAMGIESEAIIVRG